MKQQVIDIANRAIAELEVRMEECQKKDEIDFVYENYELYYEGGKEAIAIVEAWAEKNGLVMDCGGMTGNYPMHWIEFVFPFTKRHNFPKKHDR
ncbi:hypothetical protein [Telluribacter humicola]|uniref:hypothetical protein n=1 Tax=Telluribacter humicola TaxID=1720261 RepID=UPI001A95AF0D|nr:hypothetical protein [Telluribacter humicola]